MHNNISFSATGKFSTNVWNILTPCSHRRLNRLHRVQHTQQPKYDVFHAFQIARKLRLKIYQPYAYTIAYTVSWWFRNEATKRTFLTTPIAYVQKRCKNDSAVWQKPTKMGICTEAWELDLSIWSDAWKVRMKYHENLSFGAILRDGFFSYFCWAKLPIVFHGFVILCWYFSFSGIV